MPVSPIASNADTNLSLQKYAQHSSAYFVRAPLSFHQLLTASPPPPAQHLLRPLVAHVTRRLGRPVFPRPLLPQPPAPPHAVPNRHFACKRNETYCESQLEVATAKQSEFIVQPSRGNLRQGEADEQVP
jgi:hypothetical protein